MGQTHKTVKDLSLFLEAKCRRCQGQGTLEMREMLGDNATLVSGPPVIPCKECNGQGYVGFRVEFETLVQLIAKEVLDTDISEL